MSLRLVLCEFLRLGLFFFLDFLNAFWVILILLIPTFFFCFSLSVFWAS